MTTKEMILKVLETLEDDSSMEEAIYRLKLLRKIEIGLQQVADGLGMEHDEFMNQLEAEQID
jgi:hypothetical protein